MHTESREIEVTVAALDIENLTLAFSGHQLFTGLSFKLWAGERLVLRGPSGCGKSSLLRCLLGYIQPTTGQIRVFGQNLNHHSVWALRTRMAYVAQEPELAEGRVRDLLARPFSFRVNRHLQKNLELLPSLFDQLLLPHDLLEREAQQLSGGEKQRIAMVSALLLQREILLLDEASSALDPAASQAMVELMVARRDLTILAVSHEREWAGFSAATLELRSTAPETV
ncbi:ABC transporter ATP-binding protein [Geopsychrobacter electrodiphilus]|uniref:ABC transporter ATP-binding protein n=1 Tax=Geopsychrobacter electrodiphilus TaxID=225196 RepID=UPI00146E2513|nr:ATP-binding cassette domain-containing protein [Geopsychrobacter electrodiphilus]